MVPGDDRPTAEISEARIARLRGREAVSVGKRLIRKHREFTAGYELAARGYDDLKRPKRAIRILQKGLARVPEAWRLIEALAIRYSDQDRLEEALSLLDRALEIAPDQASLHYNRALVAGRMNRGAAALGSVLRALEIEPTLTSASLLAAGLECTAGRLDDGKARLEALIERLQTPDKSVPEAAGLSDAYRALAEIELAYKRRERALELFWKAVEHEKHNAAARYWIRELSGERSAASCYYRMVVVGRTPDAEAPGGMRGFQTLYDVVAESPEEALELIRPFEPPEVRDSLRVDSAKIMKRAVSDPKGVYRTSAYRWQGTGG